MNILRVVGVFWAASLLVLLAGCVATPQKPIYRRSTMEIFPPKSANYSMPVLYEHPKRNFELIGRFSYFGATSVPTKGGSKTTGLPLRSELMEAAKAKARRVGADALFVYDNSVISEPYSREIRKCDPGIPDTPDKKDSKGKGDKNEKSSDRATGQPSNYNPSPNTPDWYSETVTGRTYSLAFDVEFIVYRGSEIPTETPVKTVMIPFRPWTEVSLQQITPLPDKRLGVGGRLRPH